MLSGRTIYTSSTLDTFRQPKLETNKNKNSYFEIEEEVLKKLGSHIRSISSSASLFYRREQHNKWVLGKSTKVRDNAAAWRKTEEGSLFNKR